MNWLFDIDDIEQETVKVDCNDSNLKRSRLNASIEDEVINLISDDDDDDDDDGYNETEEPNSKRIRTSIDGDDDNNSDTDASIGEYLIYFLALVNRLILFIFLFIYIFYFFLSFQLQKTSQ